MIDVLLVSGLGHDAANPHPGLKRLGACLEGFGRVVAYAAYNTHQLGTARLIIAHSLGATAAVERASSERAILLDPVRPWTGGWFFEPWDLRPLMCVIPTLLVRNVTEGFPRSVDVVGGDVKTIITKLDHNALVDDGLTINAILEWLK